MLEYGEILRYLAKNPPRIEAERQLHASLLDLLAKCLRMNERVIDIDSRRAERRLPPPNYPQTIYAQESYGQGQYKQARYPQGQQVQRLQEQRVWEERRIPPERRLPHYPQQRRLPAS
jgi:hypothetical protein